jgi:hypothetical protein
VRVRWDIRHDEDGADDEDDEDEDHEDEDDEEDEDEEESSTELGDCSTPHAGKQVGKPGAGGSWSEASCELSDVGRYDEMRVPPVQSCPVLSGSG